MTGEMLNYHTTSKYAEAIRRMAKWGLNLADYVPGADGALPYREDTRFGFGNAETVASWIGTKFANLSEAQTAYPIIQSTSDTLDWVLLQTAIDDAIYGALGNSNKGNTKRVLKIPAGLYHCNRPLHIGYGRAGTPPAALNGNGYVTITLEGEGATVDSSGNGMTGVTIQFSSQQGIVVHGYQRVMIKGIAVLGPHLSWMANNLNAILHDAEIGSLDTWKPTGISNDNWSGGAAVSIGIGMDLYSNSTSAAAHPARPLPAAFGGGTTSAMFGSGAGGTYLICEDVIIGGFIIGFGRPHGDANGEFMEINGGNITMCTYGVVIGHSQARNTCVRNTNFYGFHTAIGSRGGTQGNSNMHGSWDNMHAAYGYQIIDHPNADWSGAMAIRDLYAEGIFRIGNWANILKLDQCYFSFWEIDGNFGVAEHHYAVSHLILDGGTYTGLRHGLMSSGSENSKIDITNGVNIVPGWNQNYANHANVTLISQGIAYMGGVLHWPGYNQRRFTSDATKSRYGYNNDVGSDADGITFLDQEWVDYSMMHPMIYGQVGTLTANSVGSSHIFHVPKISKWQHSISYTSRTGFDTVCDRPALGDIKPDVGDVLMTYPASGAVDALRVRTWWIVVDATSTTITIRQISNYFGESQYDYQPNQNYQIDPNTGDYVGGGVAPGYNLFLYICTRVRYNRALWIGDVTSGSNVITNVKNALAYGSVDDFNSTNCLMEVGDFFLHHELDRANTGGAGLKVHNKITAIDYTANTITLTENFNIDKANYPLPFYVKMHTA